MQKLFQLVCFALAIPILASGCEEKEKQADITYQSIEKSLQSRLILAEDGDTIQLPAGHFAFTRSLLLDNKKNIIIQGEGMDQTFLSFKTQKEGAEGLRITNSRNIILQDFTIQDSPGDNIKAMDTDHITFRRLRTTWTGGPKPSNGAYGLYPVKCRNVLIEACEASGASDAGIYVGQSNYAIIRNNKVFENVAGIESENTRFADIYGNETWNNTGGILVFDLPGLSQSGHHVRVFDNIIRDNNLKNFAPEGNIVAVVPPGTGIIVLATTQVEIFNNQVLDNKTTGTALISYILVNEVSADSEESGEEAGSAQRINREFLEDKTYNPYIRSAYIHDNEYQNKHWFPSLSNDFGKLFLLKFPFNTPDIIYDGIQPETAQSNAFKLCIQNNQEASFANLDAAKGFENLSKNLEPYNCNEGKLKAVELEKISVMLEQATEESGAQTEVSF